MYIDTKYGHTCMHIRSRYTCTILFLICTYLLLIAMCILTLLEMPCHMYVRHTNNSVMHAWIDVGLALRNIDVSSGISKFVSKSFKCYS